MATETFNIYIRLGADGQIRALTDWEIGDGMDMADMWDGDERFRDIIVAVTATLPTAADVENPNVSVTIPDEEPGLVAATAG